MNAVWRIDKAARTESESFSGAGAAMTGGRWNQEGTRIVYAAESLSLAAMEKFVHMGDEGRGIRLVSYRVDIPSSLRIEVLQPADIPRDWKAVPASESTMDIGTEWTRKTRSAVLKVPSVVIEGEHNYLLNPLHGDFLKLKISPPAAFRFDPRMWKS